jgi:MFS family permease
VAAYLGRFEHLSVLKVNQENLAIWSDTCTFLLSAFLISTLAIPRRSRRPRTGKVDLGQGVRDVREGWRFIGQNAVVRSVILAMSCGLIGGGMVVPLGPGFARDVLGGGPRAFGALITAAGLGVALGVVGVTSVQKRLRPERVFLLALPVAGGCLAAAASMSVLTPTLLFVALFGMAGGSIYVFGFSLVQAHTEDALRGRIFSALYAAVRLCIVASFVLGPLLASLLGRLSRSLVGGEVGIGGWHVALPGSRLALWLAGGIILGSGVLARRSLRADAERRARRSGADQPVQPVAEESDSERSSRPPVADQRGHAVASGSDPERTPFRPAAEQPIQPVASGSGASNGAAAGFEGALAAEGLRPEAGADPAEEPGAADAGSSPAPLFHSTGQRAGESPPTRPASPVGAPDSPATSPGTRLPADS